MATSTDDDAALDTPALLQVCAKGGHLIAIRAPHRTGKLFETELLAVAELHGLPSDALVLLTKSDFSALPLLMAHGRGAAWCHGDSRTIVRAGTPGAPATHCLHCAAPRPGEPLNGTFGLCFDEAAVGRAGLDGGGHNASAWRSRPRRRTSPPSPSASPAPGATAS